jgi:hypothetical protein
VSVRTPNIAKREREETMKIYSKKRLRKVLGYEYDRGFSEAVTSVIKAIESGDKVILGNNTSFVGWTATAPITAVGMNQHWMNGLFTMDPKYKKAGHKHMVKIAGKL